MTTPLHTRPSRAGLRRMLAITLLTLTLPMAVTAAQQRSFATPEAAVDALVLALQGNDEAALVALVGEKHRSLVITGDRASDAARHADAAAQLAVYRALDARGPDRRVLLVGAQAWPLPIPLVREGVAWRFATEEGVEEMLNRRIGSNEHSAIGVLRAYLDAQRLYASADRNGDGVLEYAQKLASTSGRRDGLYWAEDTTKGEEMSPFGPLIAESAAYTVGRSAGDPYRGYHFRIITRQGPHAAGGAYGYVIHGRLVAGFAMVASPAAYGESGVMSFIVNHNGRIFQKDLGANATQAANQLASFDPGPGWTEVTP